MEAHSGHYRPTPENFDQLVSILTSSGADLTLARVSSCFSAAMHVVTKCRHMDDDISA